MNAPLATELAGIVRAAGRVGVLMGGSSAEREISLKSGRAVLAALQSAGVDAIALDWNGTLAGLLAQHDCDRFFIALHGRGGEDGQVQAALDLQQIPYTGTGVLGCALAMDKWRAKLAWQGAGLPTPPFAIVTSTSVASEVIAQLGLPLIIKPAREGSSLGVSKVKHASELAGAIASARQYDEVVIAERWIDGGEYTLSIVNRRALPMIRIETPHEIYDYQAKYFATTTRYLCPCDLSAEAEQAAAELGLKAFDTLAARGWGRVDFMRDLQGKLWLIELNTVPGMTDHSLVPMAARQAGLSFADLCLAILSSSITTMSTP